MADIDITKDRTGETMVVQAEGLTEAGTEFVDAYLVSEEMTVVDSGRIIIWERDLPTFVHAAEESGLEVSR